MFENVDGRTTDAGVTGILIAHLRAFGSGELIKYCLNQQSLTVLGVNLLRSTNLTNITSWLIY